MRIIFTRISAHPLLDQGAQSLDSLLALVLSNQFAHVFAGVAVLAGLDPLGDEGPQGVREGDVHGAGAHSGIVIPLATVVKTSSILGARCQPWQLSCLTFDEPGWQQLDRPLSATTGRAPPADLGRTTTSNRTALYSPQSREKKCPKTSVPMLFKPQRRSSPRRSRQTPPLEGQSFHTQTFQPTCLSRSEQCLRELKWPRSWAKADGDAVMPSLVSATTGHWQTTGVG